MSLCLICVLKNVTFLNVMILADLFSLKDTCMISMT